MVNKIRQWFFAALVVFSSCYKEADVQQSQVFLNAGATPASITADGVSKTLISIELPAKTTDAANSIIFNTTKGLFDVALKNTITVSAQNVNQADGIHKIATVSLISTTDEGPATVTATIKNYTQTITVNFTRAYPDLIHTLVDNLNYQIASGKEITVTVQLKRNTGTGTCSTGQSITLIAVDSTNQAIGNFRNINTITDATGTCANYFSLPLTTTYLGKIKITATAQKDASGTTISDTNQITTNK